MKIMIVDDNVKIRETIRKIISSERDEIVEAADGVEAIELYAKTKPDWVLMDIRMPMMDGIEATGLIHHNFPESHIVIVTDFADDRHREAAEKAGAYAFVTKENLTKLRKIIHH